MLSKLRFVVSKRLANIKRNRVTASTNSKNLEKKDVTDKPITRVAEVNNQIAEAKGEVPKGEAPKV